MKRQSRWLWAIVAILLLPVLVLYTQIAMVEPIQNWQADDLAINYSAATVLRSGGSMYDVRPCVPRMKYALARPAICFRRCS